MEKTSENKKNSAERVYWAQDQTQDLDTVSNTNHSAR